MNENPYQPTQQTSPRHTDRPLASTAWPRRLAHLLAAGLITASLAWGIGEGIWWLIPLAFVASLAILRTWHMQQAGTDQAESLAWARYLKVMTVSLFAVLPIAVASVISFCCVCTPTGYVSMIAYGFLGIGKGYDSIGYGVGTGLFVGMFAAFELGFHFLRRANYMQRKATES